MTPAEAQGFARRFRLFADPVRVQMIAALAAAPDGLSVKELTDRIDRSQPTLSHHVKLLDEAGLLDRGGKPRPDHTVPIKLRRPVLDLQADWLKDPR